MANPVYHTDFYYVQKPAIDVAHSLSMLIEPACFSYAIFSKGYQSCIELAHLKLDQHSVIANDVSGDLSFLIHNHLLHQKKFDKVNLAVVSSDFTLVPEAFASSAHAKTLLSFSAGSSTSQFQLHHHLKGLECYFSLPQEVSGLFENTFRNVSIRHAGAVTIDLLLNHQSLSFTDIFLNIHQTTMELAVKQNNSLLFYNSFRYENHEDVLYYLLFTMEQLDLNPLLAKLSIAGQMEPEGDLSKSIRKYMKQVSFCHSKGTNAVIAGSQPLSPHYYFTLLNQHLCEL